MFTFVSMDIPWKKYFTRGWLNEQFKYFHNILFFYRLEYLLFKGIQKNGKDLIINLKFSTPL